MMILITTVQAARGSNSLYRQKKEAVRALYPGSSMRFGGSSIGTLAVLQSCVSGLIVPEDTNGPTLSEFQSEESSAITKRDFPWYMVVEEVTSNLRIIGAFLIWSSLYNFGNLAFNLLIAMVGPTYNTIVQFVSCEPAKDIAKREAPLSDNYDYDGVCTLAYTKSIAQYNGDYYIAMDLGKRSDFIMHDGSGNWIDRIAHCATNPNYNADYFKLYTAGDYGQQHW
ncbi:hypothetical protein Cantr_01144 [Candida viswanathii]|uniref:Uncharacterized protein n=1 Tax=Candida viswanathii TaxID=5486 RepID=A0A367YKU0_9ASCO|nr:hypothetical protein Cantr_01144 [Candida viswanathii]